jgi:transposase-like protein
MDETNDGKAKQPRRSRAEIAAVVAGYRESGLTQRAYAKQVGVSLASIARWVHGKGQGGAQAPGGFAAVQLRAEPAAAADSAVKIRWPEGVEMELPRSLGESILRRCLREVLLSCSR